jgi:glycerol-3-phosphate dehydrogenase
VPEAAEPTRGVAPLTREAALDRLPDEVDVLVVGGGITGVGVALDAASRGASVALVERGDLASGTSSRSSRLVHGGARYLATGDLAMVAEGVRERDRLRRMAPHLVLPLPFVVPADTRADLALLQLGMTAYDALACGRGIGRHRTLGVADVLRAAPGLAGGFARGGVRYWDARTDDSRLTFEVARAAVGAGAVVAPHVEVVAMHRRGGRVVGATVRDVIGDTTREIAAGAVVSAAGVWAAEVQHLDGEGELDVVAARGVHLVFDRVDLPVAAAVVLPSPHGDRRRLFVVPWGHQVYVGTTDDPHDGGLDELTVATDDAAYVLATTNAAFGTDLTAADAVGAWAGLRPLLRDGAGATSRPTADLSRRHAIVEDASGLLTVTGGKLTTFRRMAADVVDRLAARHGWASRSHTHELALGSSGPVATGRRHARAAASRVGVEPDLADGLHHRYGDRVAAVLRACADAGETDPLVPGLPYLAGEVRWAARHELVGRLDDVLQRRLRVSTRHRAAGGREAIDRAAVIVGEELGWSARRRDAEVAGYLEAVRTERGPVPLPG